MLLALPYLNEALILTSAACVARGWVQIRRKNVESHKRWMDAGLILAALFFISYVAKTVFVGNTAYGGPEWTQTPYQVFLQAHSILATVAGVLGLMAVRLVYKRSLAKHAKVGRWAAPIWLVTAATGLVVFLMLYVIYPPGPTVSVFDAWIGS